MAYDYAKLNGRIIEKCGTQAVFAERMGLSERTISMKLNNKIAFKQPEIQKAFEENCMSEEFAARISRPFDDGDEIARDVFRKAGAKFYTLSDEERNRWKEKLTPLHQAWVDRMVENGF